MHMILDLYAPLYLEYCTVHNIFMQHVGAVFSGSAFFARPIHIYICQKTEIYRSINFFRICATFVWLNGVT